MYSVFVAHVHIKHPTDRVRRRTEIERWIVKWVCNDPDLDRKRWRESLYVRTDRQALEQHVTARNEINEYLTKIGRCLECGHPLDA